MNGVYGEFSKKKVEEKKLSWWDTKKAQILNVFAKVCLDLGFDNMAEKAMRKHREITGRDFE